MQKQCVLRFSFKKAAEWSDEALPFCCQSLHSAQILTQFDATAWHSQGFVINAGLENLFDAMPRLFWDRAITSS
jgi:hypothetical protein